MPDYDAGSNSNNFGGMGPQLAGKLGGTKKGENFIKRGWVKRLGKPEKRYLIVVKDNPSRSFETDSDEIIRGYTDRKNVLIINRDEL